MFGIISNFSKLGIADKFITIACNCEEPVAIDTFHVCHSQASQGKIGIYEKYHEKEIYHMKPGCALETKVILAKKTLSLLTFYDKINSWYFCQYYWGQNSSYYSWMCFKHWNRIILLIIHKNKICLSLNNQINRHNVIQNVHKWGICAVISK